MNVMLRRPLRHTLGDVARAAYRLPQNPIVSGLGRLSGIRGLGSTPMPPSVNVSSVIPAVTQIYQPTTTMPSATTTTPPSISATASVASPAAVAAGAQWSNQWINPASLLNPLPQIVTHTPLPDVSPTCDAITSWVGGNPLLAAIGLVAAFLMVSKK